MLEPVIDAILRVPLTHERRIIAIAGPPASGKSTLAEALHKRIPRSAVLPMDGFHRSNADLEAHGLLSRKGAPETFDVAGFEAIVRAVRTTGTVNFPTFDRASDSVVPVGGQVTPADETILVEGNYLLLDTAPWNRLRALWDYTIRLDVPEAALEARLVQRWRDNGYDMDGARARARSNDLPNALFMRAHSTQADMVLAEG